MPRSKRQALEETMRSLQAELTALRASKMPTKSVKTEEEWERQLRERLEREKEGRVAHLQEVGLKRLFQQDLARGWSSWLEMYLEVSHKRELIREALRRLAWPKLVAAFRQWQAERNSALEARLTEKVRERNAADSDKLDALEAALAQARADHETQEALARRPCGGAAGGERGVAAHVCRRSVPPTRRARPHARRSRRSSTRMRPPSTRTSS